MRAIASLRRFHSTSSTSAASSSPTSTSSLVHTHLPALTPYSSAEALQESLRSQHLLFKSSSSSSSSSNPPPSSKPPPFLISFESTPVYTFGRQQQPKPSSSSSSSSSTLTQPLPILLPARDPPLRRTFIPDIKHTQRGGLTTYHGPGQLVLWPVIDIHSPDYPRFTVSSYAGFLEATTQRLLRDVFAIDTFISPDEPGVWVSQSQSHPDSPSKIAALGVHHRRYVTALGTAINIDVPTTGDPSSNPWARFVPCGIEGKGVTSVARELELSPSGSAAPRSAFFDLRDLAARWAALFEEGLFDESKRGGR